GETSVTEPFGPIRNRIQHSIERQVTEGVDADVPGDLVDREIRSDKILAVGSVDAVIAWAGHGRRADAHVDFHGARRAHHCDEPTCGGAAHDGIVDHDYALALQHFSYRVVLHLHLRIAAGLFRLDEGSAYIVIADKRKLVRQV